MKKEYKGLYAEKISFAESMNSNGYTGVQSGCQSIMAFTTSVLESEIAQCREASQGVPEESWGELYVTPMEREDWGL